MRENRHFKRIFLLAALFMLTLAACRGRASEIPNTPQSPVQTPAISVSPASGRLGMPIAVTGMGWKPGDNVIVSLQDPASADQAAVQVAAAVVEADGRFVAAFSIPAKAPWLDIPRVSIRAHALAAGADATSEFEIIREIVTPTAGAANTPTRMATATSAPAGCTDRAAYVADVTIPDQTSVAPGAAFLKTWRLRNDGTCTWDASYALVFAGGDNLGGPNAAALSGPVFDSISAFTAAPESSMRLIDPFGALFS